MRGLRTSIDQVRLSGNNLADKFTIIDRDLEMLTVAALSNYNADCGGSDIEEMD
jgi:hypothetical protein